MGDPYIIFAGVVEISSLSVARKPNNMFGSISAHRSVL